MSLLDRNEEQIKTTADLIRHEGQKIKMLRSTMTRSVTGEVSRANEVELPAVRRFFSGTTTDFTRVDTEEGRLTLGDFVIVGMPDDDMKPGDEFVVEGNRFRIAKIHGDTRYQVKAWCDYRG